MIQSPSSSKISPFTRGMGSAASSPTRNFGPWRSPKHSTWQKRGSALGELYMTGGSSQCHKAQFKNNTKKHSLRLATGCGV